MHYLDFIKKHNSLLFRFLLATSVAIISIILLIITFSPNSNLKKGTNKVENESINNKSNHEEKTEDEPYIYIDVSGSVVEPNLYKVNKSTRLKNAIDEAGGLSKNADVDYFYRNFNLAKTLTDQEKIYVPSYQEIFNGTFSEHPRRLKYLTDQDATNTNQQSKKTTDNNSDQKISINKATQKELETLPRIGPVTSQKIIDNRPYSNIDDLINNKVVGESTYEQIKSLISL